MFVDASAIVSILTEEEDGQRLAGVLDAASEPVTWPIAVWEAAASISRKTGRRAELELSDVLSFLDMAEVRIEPVDMAIAVAATTAFDRYGRRSGHRADLNMGDCFAYAFATTGHAPLLFKGKDFPLTDVPRFDSEATGKL